jgi:hypothetical protein
MKYLGQRTKSAIPKNAVDTQYLYTEQRGSKQIEWYYVWVPDSNQVRPVFRDDETPKKSKIKILTEFFTGKKI